MKAYGGVTVWLHSLLPQHEVVMSDQLHALAVLSLVKEPLVPNEEEPLWVLWISPALDRG